MGPGFVQSIPLKRISHRPQLCAAPKPDLNTPRNLMRSPLQANLFLKVTSCEKQTFERIKLYCCALK